MTTWVWWALGFFCGAVAEQYLGTRLRAAGRGTADRLRYWWRRKKAKWRGEDPDAWRYLTDAMRKFEATAPADDPSGGTP